jgi:hypothetical protein
MALTMDDLNGSWVDTVERFIKGNDWLDDSHLPQLKALYAIAKLIDGGAKITPALVSQFTLTQRTLAGKTPDAPTAGDTSMPPSLLDGLLD